MSVLENEEHRRELQRRADRMSSVLGHPGWIELEAEVTRKIARVKKEAGLLALSPDGADQRKLDFLRGTVSSLRWFVGVPHNAQSTLERFLREHGIEIEEEEHERDGAGFG
jgi:hypothetical protein